MATVELSKVSASPVGDHHPQLVSVVTGELRRLILEFELPPGTHLVESRLAERLGVSRNPVREAIRVLTAEGFVEITPRRGAFVAHLTVQDAENLFDVRMALEPLGARLAAHNGPELGVAALNDIVTQALTALANAQLDRLPNLITEFHIRVMDMTRNPYLMTIAVPTIKRAQWVHLPDVSERAPHTWTEHIQMARTIESGDEERAEATARAHVEAARHAYRERGPHAKHAAAASKAASNPS